MTLYISKQLPVLGSSKCVRESRTSAGSRDSCESQSKLPPLSCRSRHSLVSSSSQLSLTSLCRSDVSYTSRSTLQASDAGAAAAAAMVEGAEGCWVGEPEAISSVRRARKPLAQQRSEQFAWKRSRSLKENSRSSASAAASASQTSFTRGSGGGVSLARSQSLRDGRCGGRGSRRALYSPGRLSRTDSQSSDLSLCGGNIHEGTLQLSVECLTLDPAVEAELNRGPAHRCLRRHLNRSSKTTRSFLLPFWHHIRPNL